ncbi:FMNH2-dependent monooxygenase [Amycolatopsis antarctica]|uniref:FMNH2-dependent monooxygenase n=1 Tax=Amycolatopsis antarctica TaxID=1854586 RepID=A0A263D1W6_9PSEU|nr:LLM class flavin-dependent oxidoreductase [Amycolatopsis antarctica]OZM71637.1 FMNH2-dependent monooxygenase [Amycolatopsis antarctica]
MADGRALHLAVALNGAGWHPAAWRAAGARPAELFTAGYWTELVAEAERGALDFATFEDRLGLQSTLDDGDDDRTDQVRGHLDATLIASTVAPLTHRIGLVPDVVTTHTEPFHISKSVATLDFVSHGRAGVRARVSARRSDAAHFGRRSLPVFDPSSPQFPGLAGELFDEAADHVEVQRRLWDSWEDDAEIRDVATGRFIDREKLHYIDFEGAWFAVRGPSITPRPPQGQPPVAVLAHGAEAYRLAVRAADLVFVTPADAEDAGAIAGDLRAIREEHGLPPGTPKVFADLVVFLDEGAGVAADRKARLDQADGTEYTSDARVFAGTAAALADELTVLAEAGDLAGFRLRPAAVPHDLEAITRTLVPELRARGLFREEYTSSTLRGHLGLSRPANRYPEVTA